MNRNDSLKAKLITLIPWVLVVALGGALTFVLTTGRVGAAGASADKRIAVELTHSERDLVLQEMRMLLVSVQQVLAQTTAGDYDGASKTAKGAGLEVALQIGGEHPSILRKLPAAMKKLGFGVHRDFDRLSVMLKRDRPPVKVVARELASSLTKCAACHSAYRITVEREKTSRPGGQGASR